jgi:hypothetical protein
MSQKKELLALKFTPLVTSVMVILLAITTSLDFFKSGVFDKILEYIKALGR